MIYFVLSNKLFAFINPAKVSPAATKHKKNERREKERQSAHLQHFAVYNGHSRQLSRLARGIWLCGVVGPICKANICRHICIDVADAEPLICVSIYAVVLHRKCDVLSQQLHLCSNCKYVFVHGMEFLGSRKGGLSPLHE